MDLSDKDELFYASTGKYPCGIDLSPRGDATIEFVDGSKIQCINSTCSSRSRDKSIYISRNDYDDNSDTLWDWITSQFEIVTQKYTAVASEQTIEESNVLLDYLDSYKVTKQE